ncbi:hypothetical protein CCYN2B_50110 [Capnocytophaga cynodegmi]|uniref:Uncharacterized protein n=1 Tax=Capnocytophaga cynodegmi TaxID=28189 RepID=A0A0B7HM96_9FLAO|nr:hypothetical protein CCYN2B_50110 [Capnocytophaga cynodegmi]
MQKYLFFRILTRFLKNKSLQQKIIIGLDFEEMFKLSKK